MSVPLSLVLVAFFLAMNAFFVVAEFSMVRVRPSQIELAVEEKKHGAKFAKKIADNVNAYLGACQLGITLASLALGWLGEPAFSALIRPLLEPIGMSAELISAIAVAIGYLLMTMLHVVVGELIPKSFAIYSTEKYALNTAGVLVWFYRITYPIMWLFNGITNGVVKLAGHDLDNDHEAYTEEEIQLLIDESTESGLIDETQNEYVDNIFDLGDMDAASILTPRIDMICLDIDDPIEASLTTIFEYQFTRYPVCKGDKDSIIGFVHVKDIAALLAETKGKIKALPLRHIVAVPETIPVSKLITLLQEEHTEIAVVIDEHGGTAGIVTMSDIMSQIVGTAQDEYTHDIEDDVVEQSDGRIVVDGTLPVGDLEDIIGFLPEEEEDCDTLGGLILALMNEIPSEGDSVTIEHEGTKVVLTVAVMEDRRIDRVVIDVEKPEEL